MLNEGQSLTEVSRYSLNRIQDTVRIDVHKEYQNPQGLLKAIPVDPGGRKARADLAVEGKNLGSVLKNLVD